MEWHYDEFGQWVETCRKIKGTCRDCEKHAYREYLDDRGRTIVLCETHRQRFMRHGHTASELRGLRDTDIAFGRALLLKRRGRLTSVALTEAVNEFRRRSRLPPVDETAVRRRILHGYKYKLGE